MKGLNLNRLNLNLIMVFDALLSQRSVTKAARQLNVTQSAVSHALKKLRLFLGDPLFTKDGSGIIPTPRAEELASPVADIMRTVRGSLLTAAAFDPATSQRNFTLALDDMSELAVLPMLMDVFKQRAPGCTIRTVDAVPDSISAMLASGAADLFVGMMPGASADIVHEFLYEDTDAVIAGHRASIAGTTLTLEQFCRMRHVHISGWESVVTPPERRLSAMGLARTICWTTPHSLSVPSVIERSTDLLATFPRLMAEVLSRNYALRIFKSPLGESRLNIYQYWHRRFDGDPAHRWMRSVIHETLHLRPPQAGVAGAALKPAARRSRQARRPK